MRRSLSRLSLLFVCMALAACGATGPGSGPDFAYSYLDRYPLTGAGVRIDRIDVAAMQPGAGDAARVARIAQDFIRSGQGKIVIFVPQSGPGALASGNWVRQDLIAQGVSSHRIQWDARTLPRGIVRVAYAGGQAQWDCTNLSEDVQQRENQTSYLNRETVNFGCAFQSNMLAQADDPRDFSRPRAEGAKDPVRAANAVRRARSGTSTAAAAPALGSTTGGGTTAP